jgi:hypothetical protein
MIYVTNTVSGRVRVNGHKLKIPEYPDLEFFSYRTDLGYFVCEKQTGLALAWGKKLKIAKAEAIKRMDSMEYEELKKLIKAKLERYGRIN